MAAGSPFLEKAGRPAGRRISGIRYQVSGISLQISGIGIRYQVSESGIGIFVGAPVGIPRKASQAFFPPVQAPSLTGGPYFRLRNSDG